MKTGINLLAFLFLFGFTSCEDGGSSNPGNDTDVPNPVDTTVVDNSDSLDFPVEKPDCTIEGKILPGNEFWAKTENVIVVLSANEETFDEELGESHRILEIIDGNSCKQVFRKVLPVNRSDDFAYHLSDITYNNISKIVAIRGFDKIYILDLQSKQLSEPLKPEYLNERYAEDAQSGLIQRLEIWENYLLGYATDMGAFVFDLSAPLSAKAILPTAEYEIQKGAEYNSLFFLKSGNNQKMYQAIQPKFDLNNGDFSITPMFDEPLEVQININPSFRNNQFIIFKELLGNDESRPIGIDMKATRSIDIPANIASKKDTEIIEWMKNQ